MGIKSCQIKGSGEFATRQPEDANRVNSIDEIQRLINLKLISSCDIYCIRSADD